MYVPPDIDAIEAQGGERPQETAMPTPTRRFRAKRRYHEAVRDSERKYCRRVKRQERGSWR